MQNDRKEIKMYSDFKSPYAFLAFDPAFALETRYRVRIKWKPFQLRLKGKGERSQYSEYKVKYSYMDARARAIADRRTLRRKAWKDSRIRQQNLRIILQTRARGR